MGFHPGRSPMQHPGGGHPPPHPMMGSPHHGPHGGHPGHPMMGGPPPHPMGVPSASMSPMGGPHGGIMPPGAPLPPGAMHHSGHIGQQQPGGVPHIGPPGASPASAATTGAGPSSKDDKDKDATQVSSLPLPPTHYIDLYTDAALSRGTAPRPPPPIQDSYSMFGAPFSTDDTIIQSLEAQGIRRLYPSR